jgi:hypothetical protein
MDIHSATFPLTPAQAHAVQEHYAQCHQLPVTFTLPIPPVVTMDFQLIPPGACCQYSRWTTTGN